MPSKGHDEAHRPLGRNSVIQEDCLKVVADNQLAVLARATQVEEIHPLVHIALLLYS